MPPARCLWKYEPLGSRVDAIERHNEERADQVSVFAARRSEAPVIYSFYSGEPEYYRPTSATEGVFNRVARRPSDASRILGRPRRDRGW